jgi:hypothetical protein
LSVLAVLAAVSPAVAAAPSTQSTPSTPSATASPVAITLSVSRAKIATGQPVTLSGRVTGVAPGAQVRLYRSPYPYPVAKPLRTTAIGANGAYTFRVLPDRNTRYRVILLGTSSSSRVVRVLVVGKQVTKVRAITLGRASVVIVAFHPVDLRWGAARVSWSFATGSHGRFRPAPSTLTKKVSRHVVILRTRIALPAGHFRWRACFHAPGVRALVNPRRPPGCSGRGYHGSGFLPNGFPGPGAVARAAGFLGGQAGRTAFAVVDSEGRMSGVHEHWTFVSASVVKAMLLVAYLRRLDARGQHSVDSFSNSFLYPMIHVSDNSAATQTWSIVGDGGLYAVAHAAGMTDFSIVGIWARAQISAADQAKFFFEMDSLIPHEFVGYARFLLSTIAGFESWGIPAVARPAGYNVFFKGGWRGTGLGQLVHQVGRLEGHHRTFSIAVMTDGDPSMGYGIGTIQGVTGKLIF